MRIALGGTFDPLHDGHKKLIEKAIDLGRLNESEREVVFGVTTDDMVQKAKKTNPYEKRVLCLKQYISETFGIDVKVVPLKDRNGTTLDEHFDYLVVSPETYPVAENINKLRKVLGKDIISIEVVDFVMAEDGKPISATRIRNGEIDCHGHVL